MTGVRFTALFIIAILLFSIPIQPTGLSRRTTNVEVIEYRVNNVTIARVFRINRAFLITCNFRFLLDHVGEGIYVLNTMRHSISRYDISDAYGHGHQILEHIITSERERVMNELGHLLFVLSSGPVSPASREEFARRYRETVGGYFRKLSELIRLSIF